MSAGEQSHGFAGASSPGRAELLAAAVRWPCPGRLGESPDSLAGIGAKTASTLREELGVDSVGRLQWHLPHRFEEPPPLRRMTELTPGESATLEAEVGTVGRFQRSGGRRGRGRLEATLADAGGRGSVRAVWFNQPWVAERLAPGMTIRATGVLERSRFVVSAFTTEGEGGGLAGLPEHGWREDPGPGLHLAEPIPVHPASERLPAKTLRRFVWRALAYSEFGGEPLPSDLRRRHALPSRSAALRAAGFPGVMSAKQPAADPGIAETARRRLALEELLLRQVALRRRRREVRRATSIELGAPGELVRDWLASLPFEPTGDQVRTMGEIDIDLAGPAPMQRLLMGEVGSGKTLVALYAMLRVVEAGYQAAMMAPTEVLAEQHVQTLEAMLAGRGVEVLLVTASIGAAARREAAARLGAGDPVLAVGTHALLEGDVTLGSPGLVVVDEQHRFGVAQRARLGGTERGFAPHLLHMTATPIPRTLAVHGYGDLDASALRELPTGRRPIETRLIPPERRADAFGEVRRRLDEGRQAYVICPLVEQSEAIAARAVATETERLGADELRGVELASLHGRMAIGEKREAMRRFASGEAAVLVATTVIEVGVDVPNATTIAIEGAERFGLAQLHQLRGRVGRGPHASECLLMTDSAPTAAAAARLAALVKSTDGFELAEADLRLRGPGEILGARQHGSEDLLAASLPEDLSLLEAAREVAGTIVAEAGRPGADSAEVAILLDAAERRHPSLGAPGVAP